MRFQSFLARKFLAGSQGSWLSSSLTLIAFLGVVVSVMAFVVVQAVMTGFNRDLEQKILGFSSHLTLRLSSEEVFDAKLDDRIAKHPKIAHHGGQIRTEQFIEGEAVLRTADGENRGIKLRGIEPHAFADSKTLKIVFEEWENWESFSAKNDENKSATADRSTTADKLPGILIGVELATSLGIVPALSGSVELLFPLGEVGPTGEIEPNLRSFRVMGTFESGHSAYDSKYVLIPRTEAMALLGDHAQNQVGIFIKNPVQAGELRSFFQNLPGVESVQTWQEQHHRLFSVFKLERLGATFVRILVLVLASFNIMSMFMMVVYQRRQEIATIRALGVSSSSVAGIFYRAGLWIGLLGGILGVGLAVVLCYCLEKFPIPLSSAYPLDALPVELHSGVLVIAFGVAVGLSVLATIFPAREAAKGSVVEAFRYE